MSDQGVIEPVHVVDVAQGVIDEGRSVRLRGDQIVEVRPGDDKDNQIQGPARFLCPGLIDGHAHFFSAAAPTRAVTFSRPTTRHVCRLLGTMLRLP